MLNLVLYVLVIVVLAFSLIKVAILLSGDLTGKDRKDIKK
jgi:hypothetical protein